MVTKKLPGSYNNRREELFHESSEPARARTLSENGRPDSAKAGALIPLDIQGESISPHTQNRKPASSPKIAAGSVSNFRNVFSSCSKSYLLYNIAPIVPRK